MLESRVGARSADSNNGDRATPGPRRRVRTALPVFVAVAIGAVGASAHAFGWLSFAFPINGVPASVAELFQGSQLLPPGPGDSEPPAPVDEPAADPVSGNDSTPIVIEQFVASDAAISLGDTATLSWRVTGADDVTVVPDAGPPAAAGNSLESAVEVSPAETTTFTLTASNATETVSKTVDMQVLAGKSSRWQVKEKPPALVNPVRVDASKAGERHLRAKKLHCAGRIHQINLGSNQDAIVYMSGKKPLRYPLWVVGGRNVRIVGVQIDLETQKGCGVGRLANLPTSKHRNANIHPRIPGGVAMRVEQSKTTFIEGALLDMHGHQADCIVSRNPKGMKASTARKQRHVIVQNSTCLGNEGHGKTKIGDGVHGDLYQNQAEPVGRLVFENVSQRSSHQGIVLHRKQGVRGARELVLRRFDYSWDPRFVGDDSYELFGLAMTGHADSFKFEDVRIKLNGRNKAYVMVNKQRYGDSTWKKVKRHTGIREGLPPQGSYAQRNQTGLNYSSPHGGVPKR